MDKGKIQTEDLLHRLGDETRKMSKGHRALAKYISANYDKAAYMTANKLGEAAGVSESTVVRFSYALGYDGYPDFQKSLQELIKKKLTWVQRLYLAQITDADTIIQNSLKSDIKNLNALSDDSPVEQIKRITAKILQARNIYIIGLRSSTPIAQFLYYYLNYILENVHIVQAMAGDVFGQIMHAKRGDLAIGIAFPRYSSQTMDALTFAKKNGADIVTITDNTDSPLYALADEAVLVRSNMNSFVDSIVAPMSIINAIIVLTGMSRRTTLIDNFNMMEDIWSDYNVYGGKTERER